MNDTKYIAEQLSQLRDLLIVIERGGEKSPDVLYKLAIEKSQKITQLVEQWRNEASPANVEIPTEYALWLEGKTEEEAASLPDTSSDEEAIDIEPISMSEPADEEEYIAPFVEDTNEEPLSKADEVATASDAIPEAEVSECDLEQPASDTKPVADYVEADENIDQETKGFVEDVVEDNFVEEPTDVEEYSGEDEKYGFVEDDEDTEDDADEQLLDEEDIEAQDFYNRGEPMETDATVTVGEMLSVRQARELRKALSLNDRFRFRRELFGNSDINMNDTLNLLDTMSDLSEAREYLLQDLGWSTENPVVQEFLTLIERHFK